MHKNLLRIGIKWSLLLAASNRNEETYSLYIGQVEESRAALNDTLKELQKSNLTIAESINTENNKSKQETLIFVTGIVVIALIILVTSY